ncbi:acetoacetyl-CoA reductase [Microscilla marina]|uniref:Acetoacetyl-CoA reductase n=1 Tax=Microscilla marina ATCC 23134 TaxID=313606 RepID=A1ZL08_MICM2|nr:acetoacetyl-CoA reductase [Microscilla marina]EAY28974.1 acetoacetyl-CoA reductase [Microscilla marina ATCC 23134]
MDANNKRIALVTGATGGLGTAMCKQLFTDNYRVLANYRNPEKAEKWAAEMKAEGFEIEMFLGDVCDFDSVEKMITEIKEKVGVIDILINNAGITRDIAFHKMSKDQWDAVIGTNLTSVFNCSRHVIADMRNQGYGRIINISSVNGQRGQFGQANYSAAKAGIHGFTKTLAMEVAKKGITVNTISPGYIGTDMVMAVREDVRQKIIDQIPVGRLGGTFEVAHLVSFLASENSSFVTGANYAINGGQHVY